MYFLYCNPALFQRNISLIIGLFVALDVTSFITIFSVFPQNVVCEFMFYGDFSFSWCLLSRLWICRSNLATPCIYFLYHTLTLLLLGMWGLQRNESFTLYSFTLYYSIFLSISIFLWCKTSSNNIVVTRQSNSFSTLSSPNLPQSFWRLQLLLYRIWKLEILHDSILLLCTPG